MLSVEATGTCSPFGRRQFPRDSGCYDASLKSSRQTHHLSPQGESDTSDNTTAFSDTTNNLDSIVEQCNNEILARVRQAQKNSMNIKEDLYNIPNNIPNSSSNEKLQRKTKDSYVSVHGQTTLVDPCRKNVRGRKPNSNADDSCETDQKFTTVKYVVGGSTDLNESGGSVTLLGKGGCLSEKSSDSGVSSSSISSANPKESRPPVPNQNIIEIPALGVLSFSNCANRSTSNTASTKIGIGLEHIHEKTTFQ